MQLQRSAKTTHDKLTIIAYTSGYGTDDIADRWLPDVSEIVTQYLYLYNVTNTCFH